MILFVLMTTLTYGNGTSMTTTQISSLSECQALKQQAEKEMDVKYVHVKAFCLGGK